jgi:hypothetical protein
MTEKKSSRNTTALNTMLPTSTVPAPPQLPSLPIDKKNKEQLLDARYKDKGKVPKISLKNIKTEREESSSSTSYIKIKILHLALFHC